MLEELCVSIGAGARIFIGYQKQQNLILSCKEKYTSKLHSENMPMHIDDCQVDDGGRSGGKGGCF